MPKQPSAETQNSIFEQLIAGSLSQESLPDFSGDQEFLNSLHRKMNQINLPPESRSYLIWIQGLSRGAAAAACGLILFVSLNILPSFLLNTSVNGARLAQSNIIELSWRGRVLCQQLILNIENQSRALIKD